MWIVVNAIWVYNLTVSTGHFDVLRRSFEKVSPDQRIQAIIIAFCFGALLEALAGFGTPVAVTVVMLMALGFHPLKAAVVALVANTAPVAFGALATPIVTLATVTSGASDDPGLTVDTLGAMVGRQTPLLAAVVPLILVFIVDGRRGVRQTWLPALVCGFAFGLAQFAAANYISVPLADIVAAWSPRPPWSCCSAAGAPPRRSRPSRRRAAPAPRPADTAPSPDGGVRHRDHRPSSDSRIDVMRAYAPYAVIIAVFSIANIPAVKEFLAEPPFTYDFAWPGLEVLNPAGEAVASTTYSSTGCPPPAP